MIYKSKLKPETPHSHESYPESIREINSCYPTYIYLRKDFFHLEASCKNTYLYGFKLDINVVIRLSIVHQRKKNKLEAQDHEPQVLHGQKMWKSFRIDFIIIIVIMCFFPSKSILRVSHCDEISC